MNKPVYLIYIYFLLTLSRFQNFLMRTSGVYRTHHIFNIPTSGDSSCLVTNKHYCKVINFCIKCSSIEDYLFKFSAFFFKTKCLVSLFQLKYNNAETQGPCLSIFYPENTNPVSLPVTAVSK